MQSSGRKGSISLEVPTWVQVPEDLGDLLLPSQEHLQGAGSGQVLHNRVLTVNSQKIQEDNAFLNK